MKKLSFSVVILLLFIAQPVFGMELREIESSEQLAHFIYDMTTKNVPIDDLLKGIESKQKLKITGYETEIPVREIFATIVVERFGERLEGKLFEGKKTYATREICGLQGFRGPSVAVHD